MVRQLPPSVQLVDEEDLEQDASMTIKLSANDKSRAIIQLAKPVNLPDGTCIMVDLSRSKLKTGYYKNPMTIFVDQLATEFTDNVPTPVTSDSQASDKPKKGFLGRNQAKVSEKNNITVTHLGKTFSMGGRAQKLGGSRGLGQKKTTNILERVLCVLAFYKITSGNVYLIMSIPFEGGSDWETQENLALAAVEGTKLFTSYPKEGALDHEVKIVPSVVPETFYAEKYPRLCDSEYPNWEEENHYVYDIGYQTFIKAAFSFDETTSELYFDADLSECHDGFGLSRYYKYAADKCGYEQPEDPLFIEAVNKKEAIFETSEGKYDLSSAIPMAHAQYFSELLSKSKLARGFTKFSVVGGGAHDFGEELCEAYPRCESFVAELPALGNVIGGVLSLPIEFANT